jgi:hypothetical protein
MLTRAEEKFFVDGLALHEAKYLAGTNPRQQSGFGRDERDWERFRRPVVAPIETDGSFLDIGCANGLLMEGVFAWARADGHLVEPYGLDISEKLAELARQRLPRWRERIFVGNALFWKPPARYDLLCAGSTPCDSWSVSSRREDGSSSARTEARDQKVPAPSFWWTRSGTGGYRSTVSTTS